MNPLKLFKNRTAPSYFEERYKKNADPWNFAGSDYEQGRFDAIIHALEHQHYTRAIEPGCSIGTLTERLAALADHVDAFDFSATAAEHAKQRCAALPNVTVTQNALREDTDLTGYDLVVFSEVGYYFKESAWRAMVPRFAAELAPGATLLASHWLGKSNDHRQSGDGVHEILRSEPSLKLEHEERHEHFRLDRFRRT